VRTTWYRRCGDGRELGRWVRPVQGETSLVGKAPEEPAAGDAAGRLNDGMDDGDL
jgi:hypothetical protein